MICLLFICLSKESAFEEPKFINFYHKESLDSDEEEFKEPANNGGENDNQMIVAGKKEAEAPRIYPNVFYFFDDYLCDCSLETCISFDRQQKARNNLQFRNQKMKFYAIPPGWQRLEQRTLSELLVQSKLDSTHNLLFHSTQKYDALGLGDSSEVRDLIRTMQEKRQKYKDY